MMHSEIDATGFWLGVVPVIYKKILSFTKTQFFSLVHKEVDRVEHLIASVCQWLCLMGRTHLFKSSVAVLPYQGR